MTVFYLLCIAMGLMTLIKWRTVARDHLEFQRYLLSKPALQYDEITMRLTTGLYVIGAAIALAVGTAGLLGLITFNR